MKRHLGLLGLVASLSFPPTALGQNGHSHSSSRVIDFPDTAHYLSLTCDLHMHSVFSDGSVWPNIRVQEAQRDGLDCIAITEHLEYQPHKDDIPHPDRNRAFDIALSSAGESGLIVIRGSEITRALPHGHGNAIFIQDANALVVEDATEAYAEAHRQGAFSFMDHPNWTSQRKDGIARLEETNIELIERGYVSGIEVVNDATYSDEALEIALNYNLAIIGTSDIHGLVDWQYRVAEGGHRPITIIFAEERSEQGLLDALNARRTAAWYQNTLIGREELVLPLVEASISVSSARYGGDTSVLRIELMNNSDAEYSLKNSSSYRFHNVADILTVAPHHSTTLLVKTLTRIESIDLSFEVLNVVTAPGQHPTLELSSMIEE